MARRLNQQKNALATTHSTQSRTRGWKTILLLFVLLGFPLFCYAAKSTQSAPLRVGVIPGPPFVNVVDQNYSGIAVDLWRELAAANHLPYQFVLLNENINAAIDAVAQGKIDLAIGPISTTYPRLAKVDFTRPFYLNQVGLIVSDKEANIWDIAQSFIDYTFGALLLAFIIFVIVHVHIIWYFERENIPEFPKTYWKGISHVFWLHILRKYFSLPTTLSARIASFIWLAVTATLIAAIMASATSRLTVALSHSDQSLVSVGQLNGRLAAAVEGTTNVDEAKKFGMRVLEAKNLKEAIDWLAAGKVQYVVHDYAIAKYYLMTHPQLRIHMAKLTLGNDEFAFAIRKNNPLREQINYQIARLQDNGFSEAICQKYISVDANYCKL